MRCVISVCRHVCELASFPHCLYPCSNPGRTLNLTLTYTVHDRNTCQHSPMAILTTKNINLLNCRSSLLDTFNVGRDSDGMDVLGIESRWRGFFPYPSRPALRSTQPPVQWVPGHSRGVKRPGRGVNYPPQLGPRFKKEYSYTSTHRLRLHGRL